jgi:uncharacterized protein YjbJ (UPF0337 family)
MNNDVVDGKWKQIRGEAKSWWGKLTDNDLDRAAGKVDVLAGILQEKYGYTRENAMNDINKHVTAFETGLKEKKAPVSTK